MASDKQIAANRLNAQKCTGPKTAEGKARSSQNALKTGIDARSDLIEGESPEQYEFLTTEYYTRFNPTVPEERCLVDTLIRSEWLGRRYMAIDAGIVENECRYMEKWIATPGAAFVQSSQVFARLDRRINSAQRNFQTALKHLMALQANPASHAEIERLAETSTPDMTADLPTPPGDRPANDDIPAAAASNIDAADTTNAPLNSETVSLRTPAPAVSFPLVARAPASSTASNSPAEKENTPPIAA